MPTYTYECKKCSHTMDVFHSMNETPKVKCEACGSTRMVKQLGVGAGIIFKGSGFYETDYVKKGKSGAEKGGEGAKKSEKAEKTETKSSTKSDSGSSAKSTGSKSD